MVGIAARNDFRPHELMIYGKSKIYPEDAFNAFTTCKVEPLYYGYRRDYASESAIGKCLQYIVTIDIIPCGTEIAWSQYRGVRLIRVAPDSGFTIRLPDN